MTIIGTKLREYQTFGDENLAIPSFVWMYQYKQSTGVESKRRSPNLTEFG